MEKKGVLRKTTSLFEHNPNLAAEWHPTKNGALTPSDINIGSHDKVWWLGKCGHEWQASVRGRIHGAGCPFCSGHSVLSGFNDLATFNSRIASEWHPTKNGTLTPEQVGPFSNRKVWWKCKKGHEWYAKVKNRCPDHSCPYCSGALPIVGETDLATVNPQLAKQWHPTKNGDLTPEQVMPFSEKKVWWQCDKGHEWQAFVYERSRNCGCPVCGNKAVLPGYNDLATTHPDLAAQWHPTKNGNLTAETVTFGSNKKVWWVCNKGHEWCTTPNSRTNRNKEHLLNCPVCSSELKTSFAEQALYFYFRQKTTAVNRDNSFGKEVDIWLPDLKIGIEHNGLFFHKDSEKDKKKIAYFAKKNIRIITINESLNNDQLDDVIEYDHRKEDALQWAIAKAFELIGIEAPQINLSIDSADILEQYIQMEKENSLAEKYPDIAAEWHPTKNGNLTAEMVTFGSSKNVWWLGKCGHEWQMKIQARTVGQVCPYCSGKQVLPGYNDLETVNPLIASQWHPTKNGELTPNQVRPFSQKKVWWQCDKGHEWQAAVCQRTRDRGCPFCGNKAVLPGYNDLATTHPDLAAQWHPTKNGDLTPRQTTYGARNRVWWKCAKGHEWKTTINSRTNRKVNCPFCSGKMVLAGYNDLATVNPALAAEWHPDKNNIKPTDITKGSSKNVWWRCSKGHEWQAKVAVRSKGAGCPVCREQSKNNIL